MAYFVLEFFNYVAVASLIGLAALSLPCFLVLPISFDGIWYSVCIVNFLALVRTALEVITVYKTIDFTQNYSENLTRDVVEMTVDAMNSKTRPNRLLSSYPNISVSRSTRRGNKFFSPEVEEKSTT